MDETSNGWVAIGAGLGAASVVLGAFGAHALQDKLDPEQLDLWRTAVLYHALHASALVGWGLHRAQTGRSAAPGWCLAVGTLAFSGSLYGLALGGPRWLGPITPLGGVLLIAGWSLFAVQALRGRRALSAS